MKRAKRNARLVRNATERDLVILDWRTQDLIAAVDSQAATIGRQSKVIRQLQRRNKPTQDDTSPVLVAALLDEVRGVVDREEQHAGRLVYDRYQRELAEADRIHKETCRSIVAMGKRRFPDLSTDYFNHVNSVTAAANREYKSRRQRAKQRYRDATSPAACERRREEARRKVLARYVNGDLLLRMAKV